MQRNALLPYSDSDTAVAEWVVNADSEDEVSTNDCQATVLSFVRSGSSRKKARALAATAALEYICTNVLGEGERLQELRNSEPPRVLQVDS